LLSFTFLKTYKISFSLSSFLDLEVFEGKWEIFLKMEFIQLGLTFEVLVVVSVYTGVGYFLFIFISVSISSSSFISICLDLYSSSSFSLRNVIALTFSFGFNAWEGNFSLTCASNFLTLEVTCSICFSKLWIHYLVSYWKDMDCFYKVIVLKVKVFIISQRSSLDEPISLRFIRAGAYLT